MPEITTTPIQISIAASTLTLPLIDMLAKQRAEEPETHFRIIETTPEDQRQGLIDGRYCLGFSLAPGKYLDILQTIPLWRDELVIVAPPQSPLLAFDKIPLREILKYPLILWHWKDYEILNQQIDALLVSMEREGKMKCHIAKRVTSFGFMAVLVAAGYGVGVCTQAWSSVAHKTGIEMRSFANQPYYVTTYLTHRPQPLSAPVERFIQRAQQFTHNFNSDKPPLVW